MFKKLIQVLTGSPPLATAVDDFSQMLKLATELVLEASAAYAGAPMSAEERTAIYEKDIQVNKLERKIRKNIVAHLSGPDPSDAPYCLLLMSLVKDIERLGDFAKNLIEVPEISGCEMPQDEIVAELNEIRQTVERLTREAVDVYMRSDKDSAIELTKEGRSVAKRCDRLFPVIAASDHPACSAVHLTLGTRFYKRINGHVLNFVSSVIMPLHKLDYYDESALPED